MEAPNGPAALTLCDAHQGQIRLLITDVVMPQMNGRQLAQLLTAKRPEMAVLYMSGYTDDVIAHQGLLEVGIDFIEKSAISSRLASKVRQILGASGGPRDSSPLAEASPARPVPG